MPIVEHAFSYGGLLIRTFRHSDAVPPPSLPLPAPDASEPPWASEQLPPPKRRKGAWERKQVPVGTSSSSVSTVTAPGTLTWVLPSPSETTTTEPTRAICTRKPPTPAPTDPSSVGIEPRASDYTRRFTPEEPRAVRTRQGRGEPWIPPEPTAYEPERLRGENELQRRTEGCGEVFAPVRYMQETGCATDVDRFAVEAGVRGADTGALDCDPVYGGSCDTGTVVGLRDMVEARNVEIGVESGGGYAQRPPVRSPLPLHQPVPRPAINKHGLYFPTFSTKLPPCDIPAAHPAPPPSTHQVSAPGSLSPEPAPSTPHTQPLPPTTDPKPKRGRGRPRKAPPADGTTTHPPKSTTHNFDTPSALLTHITQEIASSAAGFIPRPLNVTYTLPIPTSESEYRPFALSLIRGISAADQFHWTIAHSQWTTSKTNPTVGARWVCNLNEDVRRHNDATPRSTRYPCGGVITARFSMAKGIVTVRYSHHALHAPAGS